MRGALLGAIAVVVVSVVVAVALGAGQGEDGDDVAAPTSTTREAERLERIGSEEVDGNRPLAGGDGPEAYRIEYRVQLRGAAPQDEVLTVVRPFTSETVTTADGGDPIGVHRWAFGRTITNLAGEDQRVFAVMPGTPGYDVRLAPVLDAALDRGLLERREQREVAGRRCQVYRAATSVTDGTLKPLDPASDEYADVCFDAGGLILEEWWVLEGEPLRQRVAVDVSESAPTAFGAGWSEEAPTADVRNGGGSIKRLREGSAPPGAFFEVGAVPAGFEKLGRFTVVPPQAIDLSGDTTGLVALTADVWTRGPDLLVLDQGGTYGGGATYEPDPDNATVEIPDLGTAEIVLGLATNEIRIPRSAGQYVRVIGTVEPDVLVAVARSLVRTEGSGLVVEDGPLLG